MSESSRAHFLIDRCKETHPLAYNLALVCSPAARIEPELLRALRLAFVRHADASAEADLWFSALVQFRSRQGIVLVPVNDPSAPLNSDEVPLE